MVQASSGLGKTGIYLISILEMMVPVNGNYTPHSCIIIGNTRELVHQINMDLYNLSKYFRNPDLRVAGYLGGTSVHENSKDLLDYEKAPHIIVSSLGRLRHLIEDEYIQGQNVQYFVMD